MATMRNAESQVNDPVEFNCSHAVRLSAGEWLIVAAVVLAVIGLAPILWARFEPFEPGPNYRVPYELSSDYWLYERYCDWVCERDKVLIVGDSVVWGHYVPPDETLSAHLNRLAGADRFANLGLDGTHPAALAGLLAHYGRAIAGRKVILHFNPLWLTSPRHDLQTEKEFHFNHPELVAQFRPEIPCYKAPFGKRLRIAAARSLPFANWLAHVRTACYEGMDLPAWTLDHPYANPLEPLTRRLPAPADPPEPTGGTWLEKGARKQPLAWVELETSVQWQFFRRAVDRLHRHDNELLILVGPFNEHLLTAPDAAKYETIKIQIRTWCKGNDIPCLIPAILPPEEYVDASHPIATGYARLAQNLWLPSALQSFLDRGS